MVTQPLGLTFAIEAMYALVYKLHVTLSKIIAKGRSPRSESSVGSFSSMCVGSLWLIHLQLSEPVAQRMRAHST